MFTPLINTLLEYGIPGAFGIISGLVFKSYFTSKTQSKIREYQNEIISCHGRILELEAKNDLLEKRVKQAEGAFSKDKIQMN